MLVITNSARNRTLLFAACESLHEDPAPKRQPDRAVDSDFVLETIVTRMPYENYEKLFQTFVHWARFGELFAYDEATHRITLET